MEDFVSKMIGENNLSSDKSWEDKLKSFLEPAKGNNDPVPKPNTNNAWNPAPAYKPKDTIKNVRIEDTRKSNPTTGSTIKDTERKSIDVDPQLLKDIIGEAKASGVDPLTALAISYQETGLKKDAPFNLNPDFYGKPTGNAKEGVKTIVDQLKYAKILQAKGVIPHGEDYLLQGYNGYGRIKKGHADLEGAQRIYGYPIPDEGVDFKHNPLYGKTVISLRELLKSNPQIQELIQTTNPYKQ